MAASSGGTGLPPGVRGLSDREAAARLRVHGQNKVSHSEGCLYDTVQGILRLVMNPLLLLLTALGSISFITGDVETGAVIAAMALISIGLGGYHQFNAEAAARLLSDGFVTQCKVFRGEGGRDVEEVSANVLVPGDVVRVRAGDMVPADVELLSGSRVLVNQSALTGESVPVEKKPTSAREYKGKRRDVSASFNSDDEGSSPSECDALLGAPSGTDDVSAESLIFMGTYVESGCAVGRVVATGEATRMGGVAKSLRGFRPKSAFDRGVESFSALMLKFTLVMSPVVFFIQTMRHGWSVDALLYAVSVGVGLTPEMLPVVVTVCLAMGAARLAKTDRVLIKHLDALPTLGQIDVLCVDKTGTLTQDKARVDIAATASGQPHLAPLLFAKLHSRYQTGIQNAIETAISEAPAQCDTGEGAGMLLPLPTGARVTLMAEDPFDFTSRRASLVLTVDKGSRGELLKSDGAFKKAARPVAVRVTKGAPAEVMSTCSRWLCAGPGRDGTAAAGPFGHGHIADFDTKARQTALKMLATYGAQGYRVLAVAAAIGPSAEKLKSMDRDSNAGICLLGFICFADPPKQSARNAVAALRSQGVTVKILTGDSPDVAMHVAREVGLLTPRAVAEKLHQPDEDVKSNAVLLGSEMRSLGQERLSDAAESAAVCARLSPIDKRRVVKALQARGHVVGFLGDGVNDCAALRASDVGVSVDAGLGVAKAAADAILATKSLLALSSCVHAGRYVFANVVKYVKMAASSSYGNMFSVLGASMVLPFAPMLPLQVVAGNLLYDFAQLMIPTDKVPAWHLRRPLCWDIGSVMRFVLLLGPVSSIFDFATFYTAYWPLDGRSNPTLFRTAWFVEGLISQTLIVFVLRTSPPDTRSGTHGDSRAGAGPRGDAEANRPSSGLVGVSACVCCVCVLLTVMPFSQREFGFTQLPLTWWPRLACILAAYAALTSMLMATVLPGLLASPAIRDNTRPAAEPNTDDLEAGVESSKKSVGWLPGFYNRLTARGGRRFTRFGEWVMGSKDGPGYETEQMGQVARAAYAAPIKLT